MTHHFAPEVAARLGINQAIVLYNLGYLQTQRAIQGGDEYYFDGRWWVRHSYESLAEWHQYLSVDQLRRIMKGLVEANHVVTRQPERFNRTTYWSVAPEFLHVAKSPDGSGEIAGSEAAKSPVVLHDNNIITIKSERQDTFDSWWAKYPKKQGKKQALKKFMGLSADKLSDCLEDDLSVRYGKTEYQFIPNPSTYLNGERWDDELEGGTEGGDSPFERYKNT
jgi:hypothetical protein